MARHDAAIVTAIVDLGRDHGRNASLDEYRHLLRHVLDIGLPVVIYADPTIADDISTEGIDVRVIPSILETLPGYNAELHRQIDAALAAGTRPPTSRDTMKDTAEYIVLQLLKPHLMQDAARLVDADRLWWIDAGIAYACDVPAGLSGTLQAFDASKATIVRDLRPGKRWVELAAPDGLGLASGGCFGVRQEEAAWFAETCDGVVRSFLDSGVTPLDEQVLTAVCLQHPQDVTVVNGWHQQLLTALSGSIITPATTGTNDSTPTRRDLLPTRRIVDLELPLDIDPGWSQFNPSICVSEDGQLAVTVRSSNYRLNQERYAIAGNEYVIRTRNAFVHLRDDLSIERATWLDDAGVRVPEPAFPVFGLEDARLFRHGGRWKISCAYREHSRSGAVRQLVATIDERPDGSRLVEPHLLHSPVAPGDLSGLVAEKNWMPMPSRDADRLTFTWSIDPCVVVEADLLTHHVVQAHGTPLRLNPHATRGGSQVVETPVGLVGIVHEVDDDVVDGDRPHRAYRHRFIRIHDGQCQMGPSWVIEEHALEYVAGMALVGERLVISYGRDDRTARLAECAWSEVLPLIPHT